MKGWQEGTADTDWNAYHESSAVQQDEKKLPSSSELERQAKSVHSDKHRLADGFRSMEGRGACVAKC